ncbi:MAG: hypothetical protein IPL23_32125 [Saprospiraceae bacterium]|nr:hypothetical protein [Saprospiraceae bacterium]
MLLQYIKEHYHLDTKALYLALDDLYFTENDLIDLVRRVCFQRWRTFVY